MTTPSPPVDEVAEAMAAIDAEREARAKEYGQYEAIDAIEILGARAFNAGDRVPASHVERGVVKSEQVRKLTTSTRKG